ncbi:hypothetical protein LJC60_09275, partial [Ruminococcaceae bacterium OttesenSCG-928-D13]|nr:hypothetical protein [Ruminococcaceae bacterium OttesenSCG-928-D13]
LPGVPDRDLPTSKAVKVTVSATKPAVTQSTKKVTLYPADAGSSATVRLDLPAGTPAIEDVKLKGAAGSCYAVDYHGGVATISLNQAGYDAARVKSQTLTLEVYLAGNAKAATTIKVGVTAQKFK